MQKPVVALLVLALILSLTSMALAPAPPQSTPLPHGSVPPLGTEIPGNTAIPDLEHLTAPSWLTGGFALQPGSDQLDRAQAFVHTLSDEQRVAMGAWLDKHPAPGPDPAVQGGPTAGSADPAQTRLSAIRAGVTRANTWRAQASAELARILPPDQYRVYEASLLPLPDLPVGGDVQIQTRTDCYNAYLGSYYTYLDAINFYLSSYYTAIATSDPYAHGVFHVAWVAYMNAYYGVVWSYDAYYYYPRSNSGYWAYYYIDHAWGLLNIGYRMAYSLYTWVGSTNSYNSWQNALAAFNHIDPTWTYADNCHDSSGSAVALRLDYKVFLPWVEALAPPTILRNPVDTPTLARRPKPYSSAPDSDKSRPPQGGELRTPPDPLHPPLPPQLAGKGPAWSLDGADNTRLVRQLARSLTGAQRERIGAALASQPPVGAISAESDLTDAVRSGKVTPQMLSNAAAEVRRRQEAVSTKLAGVLTPEQYRWYQQSMLPAPDPLDTAGIDVQSANDCYYAYLYAYYANLHSFVYYQNAYYTVVTSSDNYAYDNYNFGYQSYENSAFAFDYAARAFLSFPNSTYADYAQYYVRHANGYITWGADLARWTDSWVASSYSSNAEYYSSLAKPDIDTAVGYADVCQTSSTCGTKTLNLTARIQEQTNWCWAGTSQAIMSYLGTWVNQCSEANYVMGQTTCCSNGSSSACNQGATLTNASNNFTHWGFANTAVEASRTFSQLQSEIDSNRPMYTSWHWTTGGGHALTLYGYNSCNTGVYWADPWNFSWWGSGQTYNYGTYSYFSSASDHTWYRTVYNIHK